MKKAIRRRLQFHGVDSSGASRFTIYSLSRAGKSIQHQVLVHFENGEFHCSCEDHRYRGNRCKHVARACDWEKRRRQASTPPVSSSLSPKPLGAPAPINYDTCLED